MANKEECQNVVAFKQHLSFEDWVKNFESITTEQIDEWRILTRSISHFGKAKYAMKDVEKKVGFLLSKNADVNINDAYRMPALHEAIHCRFDGVAALLLDAGADPNIYYAGPDLDHAGYPLDFSCRKNSRSCTELLVSHGAHSFYWFFSLSERRLEEWNLMTRVTENAATQKSQPLVK